MVEKGPELEVIQETKLSVLDCLQDSRLEDLIRDDPHRFPIVRFYDNEIWIGSPYSVDSRLGILLYLIGMNQKYPSYVNWFFYENAALQEAMERAEWLRCFNEDSIYTPVDMDVIQPVLQQHRIDLPFEFDVLDLDHAHEFLAELSKHRSAKNRWKE